MKLERKLKRSFRMQRVQFDRATGTVFKSNAFVRFPVILNMERYMEPSPEDADAVERRTRTRACRVEMGALRARLEKLNTDDVRQRFFSIG